MPFFMITIPLMVVPLFISYFQKGKVKNNYLESHYIWQLRTFWFSLIWAVVGFCTIYFLIGFLVLGLDFLWFVYRNIIGINILSSRKEIYNISTKLLFRNIFILALWFVMVFSSGYYIYSVTT